MYAFLLHHITQCLLVLLFKTTTKGTCTVNCTENGITCGSHDHTHYSSILYLFLLLLNAMQ